MAWATLAVLNLSAGLIVASWPERQFDLETIRDWGRQWLVSGLDVYANEAMADYPPHAIVALSPLGLVPHWWAVGGWTLLNVGLAVLAPWLAVRVARPDAERTSALLPILMFLCWGGFRTLLQFSLVTLVLGLTAMAIADRRPLAGGVSLGMALMKPQMALPFLLWAAFTRRWRLLTIAAGVPIAGLAIFCVRARVDPSEVVRHYAEILNTYYVGNEELMMEGLAQLRPLVALTASDPVAVSAAAFMIALALLAPACVLGVSEGVTRRGLLVSAPPLVAVWSLLTFYHLTYGFIVLLPAATVLLFTVDPGTRRLRSAVFWSMQVLLMVDVPGICRRVADSLGGDHTSGLLAWGAQMDRVAMLVLFGCLLALAVRLRRHKDGWASEGAHGEL
jgi:hypothetical protein